MLYQGNFFQMPTDDCELATSSLETSKLNGVHSESPANDDSEGRFSDAVESMGDRSPESFSATATAEDDVSCDGSSLDRSDLGWEMVDGEKAIVLRPDYTIYHDIYCTDSKVFFSTNCVQVNGSTANENKRIFSIELAIDDVTEIQSLYCGKLEIAKVTLHVIARDLEQHENSNGSSGIEKLEFVVVESDWYSKLEAIQSLNRRYMALWNELSAEFNLDQVALVGLKHVLPPRKYFPKFDENFEEVIYPQGDPDAVSISMRDIDLLKPDTFVNDTIIDFYIKYLKNKIPPEERQRFHFFNCFFFRKLADMDKDPSSAFEGRAAFLRVRKWTRKLNLFDKDFIFIPVNYNYHWSLIVICHPGEIANITDEDSQKLARVPCILHMDSLRGSHANLKNLMQSYLLEEWKERQKGAVEDISSRFLNLRFVSLQLPQQQNFYDCGLFLLHYVERFLEDAPTNFSPFMITESSNFLTAQWFPSAEPSIKRGVIHQLIYNLLKKLSQPPSGNSEKWCSSNNSRTHNDDENVLEVVGERLGPYEDCRHMLASDGGHGIEMDLLQASSVRGSQCPTDSGFVLRDPFEPASSAALLLDVKCQALGRMTSFNEFTSGLLPMQAEAVADMHLVPLTITEPGFQNLDVVTPEASALQYALKDYNPEAVCAKKKSVEETHNDINMCTEKSTHDLEDNSEVDIAGNCLPGWTSLDDQTDHPALAVNINTSTAVDCTPCQMMGVLDQGDKEDPPTCLQNQSQSSHILDHSDKEDAPTCIENQSQVSHQFDDKNVQEDLLSCLENLSQISHQKDDNVQEDPPTCLENQPQISHQKDYNNVQEDPPTALENQPEISHEKGHSNVQDNNGALCDNGEMVADDKELDSDVHRSAKRIRLTCPREVEPEFSSTDLSNDLHL